MGYRMKGFSGFGEGTSPAKQKSDFDKQKGKITTYGKHDDPKRKDVGKDFYYKKKKKGGYTKISSDKVDEGSLSKTKKNKKGEYVNVAPGGPHGDTLYLKKPTPNKIWAQVAGQVIGANKRRQASKDEADAAKAQGIQQAFANKKL